MKSCEALVCCIAQGLIRALTPNRCMSTANKKKFVVVGGTGLIGSKLGALLRAAGHDVVAASPSMGINSVTGEGLEGAMRGADVVIDVSNSPSFEENEVLAFFEKSTQNLLAAEAAANVRHHIALSIVGADRMQDCAYFRAKVAQEEIIKKSSRPYTIVRATQFFEFMHSIADAGAVNGTIRLSGGLFQPIAADDVAAMLFDLALAEPKNSTIDIAGPERAPLDKLMQRYMRATGDSRPVENDMNAPYYGGRVTEFSLVPLAEALRGKLDLGAWLQSA